MPLVGSGRGISFIFASLKIAVSEMPHEATRFKRSPTHVTSNRVADWDLNHSSLRLAGRIVLSDLVS